MAKKQKKTSSAAAKSAKASSGNYNSYWLAPQKPEWSWGSDKNAEAHLFIHIKKSSKESQQSLKEQLLDWQLKDVQQNKKQSLMFFTGKNTSVWVIEPLIDVKINKEALEDNATAIVRDQVGAWYRQNAKSLKSFNVHVSGTESDLYQVLYAFMLADYSSSKALSGWEGPKTKIHFKANVNSKVFSKCLDKAYHFANGHNLARQLTNLPANILNPKSFSEFAADLFKKDKNVSVDIWGPEKLYKENCHLLYHVGLGSEHGSRLVHIRYRPKSAAKKPTAFIGKGVTFDTGGLDIKPSAGMRLMKKDMSGASVVLGLAYTAIKSGLNRPLDFYLAITENAVSDRATRPGDVHASREGHTVEIHNTDAEGRLAMADALTIAAEQSGKDAVEQIIDVSTLTGAMRVSLGLDVCGYFCNDEALNKKIQKAADTAGEMVWRQPLVPKYSKMLSSKIADMTNCSDSPFGGSITAALFLQKFIKENKWAHFDVMAWNSSSDGALSEGGNGQSFLTLSNLISL